MWGRALVLARVEAPPLRRPGPGRRPWPPPGGATQALCLAARPDRAALPFLAWGLVQATGLGVFWFFGPFLVFAIFPVLDLLIGMDATNPPDSVIKWLEQDRYYRWCTYLFIPIQYAGLVFACWLWSSGGSRPSTTSG